MNNETFIPDIDAQLSKPQFSGGTVVATDPAALMEKLNSQQQAEKVLAEKTKQDALKKLEQKTQDRLKALERGQTYIEPVEEDDDYIPKMRPPEPVKTEPRKGDSMKARIAEMEAKLGMDDSVTSGTKTEKARSFLDEYGDETFYVENISNGHVVISDLDMDKVKRGEVLDMLKFADLETLKKSRDLRVALSGYGSEKLLKRLTPEDYLSKISRKAQEKEKIQQFKLMSELKAQSGAYDEKKPIRPLIDSKLEKLRLFYTNEPHKGITPVEFIQWISTEKLSLDELDYILGSVQDKDIRLFIHEKKKDLL
jgi:hypothetical protein